MLSRLKMPPRKVGADLPVVGHSLDPLLEGGQRKAVLSAPHVRPSEELVATRRIERGKAVGDVYRGCEGGRPKGVADAPLGMDFPDSEKRDGVARNPLDMHFQERGLIGGVTMLCAVERPRLFDQVGGRQRYVARWPG
jgi:hypothetical protein